MDFLITVASFLFILGIVVTVHEFGHYITGRWCGIHADVFSIGFGREVWHHIDRRGTRWRLAALPLGGYVKFFGDADGASGADRAALAAMDPATLARSFHGAAIWKRALTVAAGPVFNFALSILVFAGLFLWQGRMVAEPVVGVVAPALQTGDGLRPGDRILTANGTAVTSFADFLAAAEALPTPGPMPVEVERDGARITLTTPFPAPALVGSTAPLSPGMDAGLREGDLIRAVAGKEIISFKELREIVLKSGAVPLTLEVQRGAERFPLTLTPKMTERQLPDGRFVTEPLIGIASGLGVSPMIESIGPLEALGAGAIRTLDVITGSVSGLYNIVLGNLSPKNLQGPLGIAQISGDIASTGLLNLINLLAVISTAIGFLNLMPIPVLDGGHLVFLGLEAARGRPVGERWIEYASGVGLAMVLLLMLFATYNDVLRLIGLA